MLFLHPALAQTRDYSRSNHTCTHFLIYDTPVHTWNKWSSERERERERKQVSDQIPPHTDCIPQTTKYLLPVSDVFQALEEKDSFPLRLGDGLHDPDEARVASVLIHKYMVL